MTKRGKVVLLILFCGAILAVLFGGLLAYSLFFSTPKVASSSILELHLKGELVEAAPVDSSFAIFSREPETLKSVLDDIRRAKSDKKIKGMLLLIDDPGIGLAKIEEIRAAILEFKQSGKPVFAFMEQSDDREYYLSTVADKIYVAPMGDVGIKGFAAQSMFMREMFDKLKVEPIFERHGKYKSFAEQYTNESMSEAHREEVESLLDDIYNRYVGEIAKARQKDPEQIKQLIDEGPYSSARAALDAGLIDGAIYFDEVKEKFKEQLKLNKYEGIKSSDYGKSRTGGSFGGDKIAIIYAAGGITSGKSSRDLFSSRTVGSDTIVAALKKAREDSDVKAVILRIDSPGGSGLASDIIWREVNLTKKDKPVIASMSDTAASGGYYIAMAANKIVAQPNTITGSIGVISGKFNLGGLFNDHLGINVETISRGKHADFYSSFRSFNEEERTKFRQQVMDFYKEFVSKAAEGRNKSFEEIDRVAQGRVWTGAQGKEQGLVDELGGLDKAIEVAKEMAKIPADRSPNLVEYPRTPGFFESLFEQEDDGADTQANSRETEIKEEILKSLPADMRETIRALSVIRQFEREPVMALMPYLITIH
jgi:protease IV